MKSDYLAPAETILQSLGITEPKEIDLEAIAWSLGAKVRFQPLDGCEARIMGKGDSAIITINSRSNHQRQRFSIGHEIGHWKKDRGQITVCRSDDIEDVNAKINSVEKRADLFAADLLMPTYLFQPILGDFRQLDFDSIRKIAGIFDVSFPAAAIRSVEKGHHPAMLVCHNMHSRRWFLPSPLVPVSRWFPRNELQPESQAMDVLYRKIAESRLHRVPATAWFDSYEANRHEVWEQSRKIGDEVLTLLLFKDPKMLEP